MDSANGACMNIRVGAVILCVGLAASACTASPSANSHPSSRRSGHTSGSPPVGPTTAPATISTVPIPSPTPACPPGCRYPSNFDAITVLASSATLVAIVTVNHPVDHGVAGSVSIDSVLQGNPNDNVYPPSLYDLTRSWPLPVQFPTGVTWSSAHSIVEVHVLRRSSPTTQPPE